MEDDAASPVSIVVDKLPLLSTQAYTGNNN